MAYEGTPKNPNQILLWNGTNWYDGYITDANISTSAIIEVSKLQPGTSAQLLLNNSTPTPTWITLSGDVSLTSAGVSTVIALQGNPVTSGTPTTGYVLTWEGSSWQAAPASTGGSASGDLSGTYPNPTVKGIDGYTLLPLADGYLNWNGTSMQWSALPTSLPPSGTAGGDLGGSYPNPTIAAIDGYSVPNPGNHTGIFNSNGSALSWGNLSGDVTSSDLTTTLATVNSNVGSFGSATQVGTFTVNGKGLITAASNMTITGVVPGGSAGGDLSGTYPNPTLAKIDGYTLPNPGSYTGYLQDVVGTLTWSPINLAGGSSYITGTLPTGNQASQTMGGDISGTTASATVAKLDGYTLPSPTAGVLQEVSGSLSWGTVNLASSTYVTGILPTANQASQSLTLTGDVTSSGGTTASATTSVVKLHGNAITSQTLGSSQDGYVLTWDNTDGYWRAAAATSVVIMGGDVTGNSSSATVAKIQGNTVTSGALSIGKILAATSTSNWASTTISGDISASVSTAGDWTVTAIQGNAVQSGTLGSSQDGYALIWVNAASQYEPKYITVPANSSVNLSGDLSGTTTGGTVTGIQNNPVSATAATAGQFLVEKASATGSAWTSLSGDISNSTSTAGLLTVNKISGTSPIAISPSSLAWTAATSSPNLTQTTPTTDVATTNLSIISQAPYASASTHKSPGNIYLDIPAALSGGTDGYVGIQRNGLTLIALGPQVGTVANGAVYGPVSPSSSNYALLASTTDSYISAPSGSVHIQNGGSDVFTVGGTGVIQYASTPTAAGIAQTAVSSGSGNNMTIAAQGTSANGGTGGSLTLQAGNATNGSGGTGGNIAITTGTGNTNVGQLTLNTGGTTLMTLNSSGIAFAGTVTSGLVSTGYINTGLYFSNPGITNTYYIGIATASTSNTMSFNMTAQSSFSNSANGGSVTIAGAPNSGGTPGGTIIYSGATAGSTTGGNLTLQGGYNSGAGNSSGSILLQSGSGTAGFITQLTANSSGITLNQLAGNGSGYVAINNSGVLSWSSGGSGITALTGDVTASGSGSVAATVAAIDGYTLPNPGNHLGVLQSSGTALTWGTVNLASSTYVSGVLPTANQASQSITGISGDASFTGTTSSGTMTLATVNSNTGSFGSTTSIPVITVNGKGLITAVSTATPAVSIISGITVSGTPSTGQILTATSSSAANWQNAPSGSFTAGGDLSGTSTSQTVVGLDGYALAIPFNLGSAQDGYVLTYKYGSGPGTFQVLQSTGGGGSGITALTGDVTASGSGSVAATVVKISGSSPIAITPSSLQWLSTTSAPTITQASTSTASATGQTMTISSQSATGTTSTGGSLILTAGTGTSADGYVQIQDPTGTNQLIASSTGVQISGGGVTQLTFDGYGAHMLPLSSGGITTLSTISWLDGYATTNATSTTAVTIPITASTSNRFTISVITQDTSGDGYLYSTDLFFTASRLGSASVVLYPTSPVPQNTVTNSSGSTCAATITNSGNNVLVNVQGVTFAVTMHWAIAIQQVIVS